MLVTILVSASVTALGLMLLFPGTPAARAIRLRLIERPATFLLDLNWKRAAKLAVMTLAVAIMMMAGPETIAMFIAAGGDVAALELLLVVWAVSVSGGLMAAVRKTARLLAHGGRLALVLASRRNRGRARRRRPKTPRHGQNDDPDRAGWALA